MLHSSKRRFYIEFTKSKKVELSEFIYLIALSIYLINAVLYTTMFYVRMNTNIMSICNVLAISIILLKIFLFDEYSVNQLLEIVLLAISGIASYFVSDYREVIYLVFFIIGAKGVSFQKIVKVHIIIIVSIMIIAMISVRFGVIEHIIYIREEKPRYAFGSIYCTDFASHIFYLVVSYCYIKYKELSIRHTVVFLLLAGITYYYNGARLDSTCIFIMSIFSLYCVMNKKIGKDIKNNLSINKLFKVLLIFSVPLFAIISIIVTMKFDDSDAIMHLLNESLSGRLGIGKIGITNYGFKWLGQKIVMIGNGGTNNSISTDYFFIDCSYLYVALQYGTLILVLLCAYYIFYNNKRIKNGDFLTPMIILVIAVNSMVEHHFTDVAYNPFILIFLASIESEIPIIRERTRIYIGALGDSTCAIS